MRRERTGADELLEQLDHFRVTGNFSDRLFVIFGHERITDPEENSPRISLRLISHSFQG